MPLIDIKKFKKENKCKNMSEAIRCALIQHMGWKTRPVGHYYVSYRKSRFPLEELSTDGIAFIKNNIKAVYQMPINKAKTIVLDTDACLLIFDDLIAIAVR